MSKFSTRLKIALENKGMRPAMLACLANVDRSTISNYLNDRYVAKFEMVRKLATVLNVSPEWLSGEDVPMAIIDKNKNSIKVPVLGYVAAGIPIEAIEEVLDYEELRPEMVKNGSEYFGLKIKGQSMEPRIYDGDVVIVRKQPDVDSGQIGIVCVNGDEATCKKVIKQETGILLQPLNPTYPPTFYTTEQIESIPITILGLVVELRGKLG